MKIYSYLHSGRPIIATDLPTHTQVLDKSVAVLTKPDQVDFGSKLLELLQSRDLRERIGQAAHARAEKEYTYEVFQRRTQRAV